MSKWHQGPPPSIGWWPTITLYQTYMFYRWWDGKCWSRPVGGYRNKTEAGIFAKSKSEHGTGIIMWSQRPKNWPARSKT
jgi:hypothetical protein